MKQSPIIIILFIAIVLVGAVAAFLFQSRGQLEADLTNAQGEQEDLEATLVAVFAENRDEEATRQAEQDAQQQQIAALEAAVAELAPLATQAVQLADAPTVTPQANPLFDEDAPPQVRIILRERESVWPVGEPLDIIASATHPIGIAVLNIAVNGETLLSDSPLDPRMNIVTSRWTPTESGTYEISAVATTIRGRASDPVIIELLVVDTTDQAAINESILRRIERNIEELRGLKQIEPITKNFVTSEELQGVFAQELFSDYTPEEANIEVQVLSMFDFVPDDYPLYENTVQTLAGAVAGFYQSDNNTLYVVDDDGQLDEEEQLTHAHEFLHALQDQYFALALLDDDSLSRDARLALRSLGEGEAELVEFLYQSRGYLTGEQQADSSPVFPTPPVEDVPDFFLSDFNFPYVRGFAFVSTFFEESGFEGVDTLWGSIPESSEQIIHPDRYRAGDQPLDVSLGDISADLGEDWILLESDVFGEFYTRLYLGLYLQDSSEVDAAATGWGGDRFVVYQNQSTGERLMILKFIWDTPEDEIEFANAYTNWAAVRMGGPPTRNEAELQCWVDGSDNLCLQSSAGETTIIRTDNSATLDVALDTASP